MKWLQYPGGIRSKDKRWSVHQDQSGRYVLMKHENKQNIRMGDYDSEIIAITVAEERTLND